MKGAVEV